MTEQHNGMKPLILSVSTVGICGLIGLVVIFVVEYHPEHAVIYAGLLTTLVATLITSILTIAGLRRIGTNQDKLVINTNSKMDMLIQATREIGIRDGQKVGEELRVAAEKLAYAAGKLAGESSLHAEEVVDQSVQD